MQEIRAGILHERPGVGPHPGIRSREIDLAGLAELAGFPVDRHDLVDDLVGEACGKDADEGVAVKEGGCGEGCRLIKSGGIRGEVDPEHDTRFTGRDRLCDEPGQGGSAVGAAVEACTEVDPLVCRIDNRTCLGFDQEDVCESEPISAGAEDRVQCLVYFGPRAPVFGIGHQTLLIYRQRVVCDVCGLEIDRSRGEPRRDVENVHGNTADCLEARDELVEIEPADGVSLGFELVNTELVEFVVRGREFLNAVDRSSAHPQRCKRCLDLLEVGVDLRSSLTRGRGQALMDQILAVAPGPGDRNDDRTDEGNDADDEDPDRQARRN